MSNKKEVEFLVEKFVNNTSYAGVGAPLIARMFGVSVNSVKMAKGITKLKMAELVNPGKRNVLFIGDLHAPFMHKMAIPFIKHMLENNNITDVVLAGDIQDNHFSSFHDVDPDGMSENDEFNKAKQQIQALYKLVPKAMVCSGNHDVIPNRKAFAAGLSSRWIKGISEALGVPGWEFKDFHEIGDFIFTHGMSQQAISRARNLGKSVAQGHYHSKFGIRSFYDTGGKKMLYAIDSGCLIDSQAYAFDYGKFGPVMLKGLTVINDIEGIPSVSQMTLDQFIDIYNG